MNYTAEVKKLLYREKPMAKLSLKSDDNSLYRSETSKGRVYFKIPENEAKDIEKEVSAQLLIRWLDWHGEIVKTLEEEK